VPQSFRHFFLIARSYLRHRFYKETKSCSGLFLRICHLLPDRTCSHVCEGRCLAVLPWSFMHWPGYYGRDVSHLVDPEVRFFRLQFHVPQCGPKTQSTIPTSQIRRNHQPSLFQALEKVSPAARMQEFCQWVSRKIVWACKIDYCILGYVAYSYYQ
jgi:hypothetical protein